MCHMSRAMCHLSRVTCHMSHIIFFFKCNLSSFEKVVKLVGGGFVINGPTPSGLLRRTIRVAKSGAVISAHSCTDDEGEKTKQDEPGLQVVVSGTRAAAHF